MPAFLFLRMPLVRNVLPFLSLFNFFNLALLTREENESSLLSLFHCHPAAAVRELHAFSLIRCCAATLRYALLHYVRTYPSRCCPPPSVACFCSAWSGWGELCCLCSCGFAGRIFLLGRRIQSSELLPLRTRRSSRRATSSPTRTPSPPSGACPETFAAQ